jgi:hypothetical protein
VKTWTEDVRLSLTFSTQAKLNLTLEYTNRRLSEISSLVAQGKLVGDQTSDQYQQELDDALKLAAQMTDQQIQAALGQIKNQAGKQGMTIQELINQLPPQADPALIRLEQRLNTQVQWTEMGEADPQAFRIQLHERMHGQPGQNKPNVTEEPLSTPVPSNNMPMPGGNGNNGSGGNDSRPSTQMPGNGDPGNGQGQSMPGNSNHEQNPKHTSSP